MKAEDFVQLVTKKDWSPFAVGQPDPTLLPTTLLKDASEQVCRNLDPAHVQYGKPAGPRPFQEAVAKWVTGSKVTAENVVLTSGNSAALGTVANRLRRKHENKFGSSKRATALVESPTYFIASEILLDSGLDIVGFDRLGLSEDPVQMIEHELVRMKSNEGFPPAFIYLIPTFHNPGGSSMTSQQINKIASLCEEHDTYLICDEPYNLLCFEENVEIPHAFIRANHSRRIISLGSFSKTLAPGLRCGFALGDPEILEQIITTSGTIWSGGGANPWSSLVVTQILNGGKFTEDHLPFLNNELKKRMDVLFDELSMPGQAPAGGYFAWVNLGIDASSPKFLSACQDERISVMPGSKTVCPNSSEEVKARCANFVRLCVAHTPEKKVRRGAQALLKIVKHLK